MNIFCFLNMPIIALSCLPAVAQTVESIGVIPEWALSKKIIREADGWPMPSLGRSGLYLSNIIQKASAVQVFKSRDARTMCLAAELPNSFFVCIAIDVSCKRLFWLRSSRIIDSSLGVNLDNHSYDDHYFYLPLDNGRVAAIYSFYFAPLQVFELDKISSNTNRWNCVNTDMALIKKSGYEFSSFEPIESRIGTIVYWFHLAGHVFKPTKGGFCEFISEPHLDAAMEKLGYKKRGDSNL